MIRDPRRTLVPTHEPAHRLTVDVPSPVRVINVGGEEHLNYRPAEMVENEIYPVKWNGENRALRKSGENVELYEFIPDNG